jgi:precorrin-2 dehydrogenase/sirohydrochlorin ferrochelatase
MFNQEAVMSSQEPFLPLMLNLRLEGRLAVVIGGGNVGQRKISTLLTHGARVRVVCLEKAPADLEEETEWVQGNYRAEDLEGASLIFAAATPEVNEKVVADAKRLGLWVNSGTDPMGGDFTLPSRWSKGNLQFGVSAYGATPFLSGYLRDLWSEQIEEEAVIWAELVAELRPLVRQQITDEGDRRRLFRLLSESSWLDRLRNEGKTAVRSAMKEVVDEYTNR